MSNPLINIDQLSSGETVDIISKYTASLQDVSILEQVYQWALENGGVYKFGLVCNVVQNKIVPDWILEDVYRRYHNTYGVWLDLSGDVWGLLNRRGKAPK